MFKSKRITFTIIVSMLFMMAVCTSISFGNAAEPPSILIIVPNAPNDLHITIGSNDEYNEASKRDKIIETYYTFYSRDLRNIHDYNLRISTENNSFEIALEESLNTYNNVFILNLENQSLTKGKSTSRSIKLVSFRIILTLMIEGLVFLLFGFRQKRSWIIFLIINLITQGGLNLWLNGFSPLASYIIFSLIFAELIIFAVEIIAFSTLVKEHSGYRKVSFVLVANLLSLIAGGYMITILPI
ncbi:hypothetical protein [Alkaliphilus peptidifermentans]|uniref:Uncharacterized protein n=1 Tax=Alkaliphilus peptidifermentans DSM 18978 TaxID=1120976 RepID=A0A1G5FEU3_9FIRM|nr:hypothetical protein [Alkaliphilus peptidifermentans]SCY37723.1 hypothetical protein SAMN03080606_01394 [Alkaliphilus peptidifermentans DSM 18978]